ncbi:hypothetical protein PAMC26577_34395 [Caballeronia sordidicola]|uniref:Uncharacterized protein n=1 Tax=Caballeronia sordidicola TaxID=196367 RepID=A0A242MAP4_CABSO|nr:hypothetical protein PAMC26577_34395 [Caballeronia sordidicola]
MLKCVKPRALPHQRFCVARHNLDVLMNHFGEFLRLSEPKPE